MLLYSLISIINININPDQSYSAQEFVLLCLQFLGAVFAGLAAIASFLAIKKQYSANLRFGVEIALLHGYKVHHANLNNASFCPQLNVSNHSTFRKCIITSANIKSARGKYIGNFVTTINEIEPGETLCFHIDKEIDMSLSDLRKHYKKVYIYVSTFSNEKFRIKCKYYRSWLSYRKGNFFYP